MGPTIKTDCYIRMADVEPGPSRPGLAAAAAVDGMLVLILPTHELLIRTTDDVDDPVSISLALARLTCLCRELHRFAGKTSLPGP